MIEVSQIDGAVPPFQIMLKDRKQILFWVKGNKTKGFGKKDLNLKVEHADFIDYILNNKIELKTRKVLIKCIQAPRIVLLDQIDDNILFICSIIGSQNAKSNKRK
jgi:hypothetical protein